ncbi:Myeloperoxidase, thyroid peroxidase, cyclooxygenase catalytic domain [Neorhizobium galegae bv. officinalis]|nr:Myeloperoxidase, thyroid peroxidase, cyclooxygenase catalytic domain [Neorhizobium galegae bv. officinalis]CDZ37800.1 Myeloperoxidase, thyroid peroxidase, cyclooxygenase catalytic domain [Neorhizobium galegae bv. officinalis]
MHHGEKNFEVTAPRSRFYQGGFGRLFPELPGWEPDTTGFTGAGIGSAAALEAYFMNFVATKMVDTTAPPAGDSKLPSGYVYFGQFIDHDLTLDTTPLSEAELDPNRLHNFRTPRLDLDCIYGQGPDAQPYLYDKTAPGCFRIGEIAGTPFKDLPRAAGQDTALIGDPRNDENAIVAQLHLAFLLAHNTLVKAAVKKGMSSRKAFEAARKTLRRLYQWIIWHDYMARICDPSVHKRALRKDRDAGNGRTFWELGYEDVYDWKNNPFMPLEFSVAAYRFGHSLVRNGYQTNFAKGVGVFTPTFKFNAEDLRGFRALHLDRVVQWDWFLRMSSSVRPTFPQVARKFDSVLANALRELPEDPDKPGDNTRILNVLAARNLVRGVRMQLPSAIEVAKLLDIPIINIAETEREALWYYILKEAEFDAQVEGSTLTVGGAGDRLGTLGSIIVAATFAGLLKGDPLSFFNLEPGWTPDKDELLDSVEADLVAAGKPGLNADEQVNGRKWGLPTIIRLSGLPVDAAPFRPAPVPVPEPVVEPAAPPTE